MKKGQSTSLRFQNKAKLLPRDISEGLGKLPPQALELEDAVLGALMLERSAIVLCIDILAPEDFYIEAHKEIYQAIMDLFKESSPVDMRSVITQLRKSGKIELVGGAYYIAELTSKVSSAANVEYHARVVAEMAMKRRLIVMASEVHQQAYEDTTDVFELMDSSQASLDEIAGKYIRRKARKAKDIYQESVQHILDSRSKKGLVGVPSGYQMLDNLTGGWRTPDLIIIAARPSMGKSVVAGCLARNAAVDFKIPTAVFSLEMSCKQFMDRMIACDSEVDLDRIMKGTLDDFELSLVGEKTKSLANAQLFIDDTPSLSILELRAKARRMKSENNIGLIIVDYLQLMKGETSGSYNREQEIASISRTLKGIAKELGVPVIALSQLSRGVETRGGDKRPQLSDLRESGAIEQDADLVMFLYRAEYYKIMQYEDGSPTQGTMEIITAKHRNGRCDTVLLKFIGKYSKVIDFSSLPIIPKDTKPGYKDMQAGRRELLEKNDLDDLPF